MRVVVSINGGALIKNGSIDWREMSQTGTLMGHNHFVSAKFLVESW